MTTAKPATDPAAKPATEPATDRFVRADGPAKVTGTGRYSADLVLPGMAIGRLVYAGVAHASIKRLDVSAAREVPGVLAVLTADDVADIRYSPVIPDRTLFAADVVRFEGEVVAAVAATSARAAADAVEAVEVEYEPLPVVNDIESALAPDAPLIHPDWESYEVSGDTVRDGNTASFSSLERGDVEAGLAEADHVITDRYVADPSQAAPIEPRAVAAQWEGDKVTIWSSTQVPFDARAGVCQTLELPTNRVRIIVPHLGGGFGGKCGFHFEAHVAALARAAGRPVKLTFTRAEEFTAPDRRREGMIIELTTGIHDDGTITARKAQVTIDNGAYAADAAFFPQLAAMHVIGPYRIDNLRVDARLVYTNHQPSGSVRAPTAPQACWALESHLDRVAGTVGLDPVEFRRRNAVADGDVGPMGQTYESVGLRECIEAATSLVDPSAPLAENEAVGVAVGWWPSLPAPSGAYVKIDDDGAGQIVTGAQECGTGAVMTLPQLAAEALGMDPERFELIYQDTGIAPYDMGATGSQTLLNNGRAVVEASRRIADQLRELAADRLEAAPGDIELADGHASVVGSPSARISIDELAGTAAEGGLLLGHGSAAPVEPPPLVGATCVGDQGMAAWVAPQFSCHSVRVRLDRETGVVRVLEVGAAHDSGTIINPVGARGQVHGGILMGIGQALTERTVYGNDGRQANPGLLDYKLQTAADAPSIRTEFIESAASEPGPRGAKGLAEAPNVATAAAVANAVAKLTGGHVDRLPMTAERVWEVFR